MYGYINSNYKDKNAENKNLLKSIIAFIILIVFAYLIIEFNIDSEYKDNYSDQTQYIISFDTKMSSNPLESMVLLKNEQINLPTLESDDYTFVGWVDENNKRINNPYTVNGDVTLIASWVKNDYETHRVSFDLNGGYGTIETQKVKDGTVASKPKNPTREGYTFVGWYYGNKAYNFKTKVSKDIILDAKWKVDTSHKFTVSFILNNGSGSPQTQKVTTGRSVTKPSNPTRNGYTFKGWYHNGEKYNFNSKVTDNITLVAYWERNNVGTASYYKISFDLNGGSGKASTQLVASGKNVTKPSSPTRIGYTFAGWYLNNKAYNFNNRVNSNMTLVAKWTKNSDKAAYYTVSFNENTGDTKVPSQKVVSGGKATKPEDPKKEGFVFLGWYYKDRLYDFDKPVTKSITLGAAWRSYTSTKYYIISFDTNGGKEKLANQDVAEGGKVKKPSNPTRNGYIFKGWYLNGQKYDFNTPVTKGFSLIAMWESDKPMYNVWFVLNGGTGNALTQTVKEGDKAYKPTNPTRSGYTFAGWYLGDTKYNFNDGVKNDLTLIAKWNKNTVSSASTIYVVSYNSNGGSSVYSQNVESGGKATKPANPTRSGYTFAGWYYNGNVFDFNTSITSNITLDASWTKNQTSQNETSGNENGNKYVVSFLSSGGSSVSAQSISAGKTASKPSNPTKSGYKFLGWYTNDREPYNFNSKVNSNIKLRALWAPQIGYSMNKSGKWIFVNNPESIDLNEYLADSNYGNSLLYKTTLSGNAEIYYEHIAGQNFLNNIYYAIRVYNPHDTNVTLKINKCGANMGVDWKNVWEQYYNGTCNIKGKTYTIPSKKSLIIYQSGNKFVVGGNEDVNSVQKVYSSFDGVLNVTASNELHMAHLAFKDITKTYSAVYKGNAEDRNTARVYSGEYSKLPELQNSLLFEIYDETPQGELTVAYKANNGTVYTTGSGKRWRTNLIGGSIDTKNGYKPVYQSTHFVGDFVRLKVPIKSGSTINLGPYNAYSEVRNIIHTLGGNSIKGWPYNWGNWAVHYNEQIKIQNYSSSTKNVSFKLVDVSGQTINYYYSGTIKGTKSDTTMWTVNVPANSTKTINTIITLGGMSNGGISRVLELNN